MEVYNQFNDTAARYPSLLQIKYPNSFSRVGCFEIVPSLRWLHWEVIRTDPLADGRFSTFLQLSESLNEDFDNALCQVRFFLGGNDIIGLFADAIGSSRVFKICFVTSDCKIHSISVDAIGNASSFLSPLIALTDKTVDDAALDINKVNRRFVYSPPNSQSTVSWYWATLQTVPEKRNLTCVSWLSSSRLVIGLTEGDLISVNIVGDCALQEFYLKDRVGMQSLWTRIVAATAKSVIPAYPRDGAGSSDIKPTDIIAVTAIAYDPSPNSGARAFLAVTLNRLGQLRVEAICSEANTGDAQQIPSGHCQHNCLLQADISADLTFNAGYSLFSHLESYSYKLGRDTQSFRLGKERLLSAAVLRAELQVNSGRHELVVAVGVGMDEFAEDEAFLLFGEKRTRKVWQVLFVGSVLQWPGWGSLPVASDKFSLLAAPFHLPSNRSASLLDLQIRVDGSVSFLISAWKSHNDELVIAKTSLPLLTEGPSQPLPNLGSQTFEWQNNEKKQRRLQDEVVMQRLRDDLSSGLSFSEKEDAVKADLLRRVFLPRRFMAVTILRSCEQMVRSIERLHQSKRGTYGSLLESESSSRSDCILWNSLVNQSFSGNIGSKPTALPDDEITSAQLIEAVFEACELLAFFQLEDASSRSLNSDQIISEEGLLKCLIDSFAYFLQLCEESQSETNGVGVGSLLLSRGSSAISCAIGASDGRISFVLEVELQESEALDGIKCALSLVESAVELTTVVQLNESTVQAILATQTSNTQRLDIIDIVRDIYATAFAGKLDLIVPRLRDIILTASRASDVSDRPFESFFRFLLKSLDLTVQGKQLESPFLAWEEAEPAAFGRNLNMRIISSLSVKRIERSLKRSQLSLILLTVLANYRGIGQFSESEDHPISLHTTLSELIPQTVLDTVRLTFLVYASTLRLSSQMDNALPAFFPLSQELSQNYSSVYSDSLSLLENYLLADRELNAFPVDQWQGIGARLDKLIRPSVACPLTSYLFRTGQHLLLRMWASILLNQNDLNQPLLSVSDNLTDPAPRFALLQQLEGAAAEYSSSISEKELSALCLITKQRIQALQSMAKIQQLQQRLTESQTEFDYFHQDSDIEQLFASIVKDISQVLNALPDEAAIVESFQLQYRQLIKVLHNGRPALLPVTREPLDSSHVTVQLQWCDDERRMNTLLSSLLDSWTVVEDSLNALAHKPVTAVVIQHITQKGNWPSFVKFYPFFSVGLSALAQLLQIYLLIDLITAVEALPRTAAGDDLVIELYCFLVDMLKFTLQMSMGSETDEFLARSVESVVEYAEEGNEQDLSEVFCGYLALELLKAFYCLFEVFLRRGGEYSRALNMLHRIWDMEKAIASTSSDGKVNIPSSAAASAYYGKIESCLQALVINAVENGELQWLCKLTESLPRDHSDEFLDIIEGQLRTMATSCDVSLFRNEPNNAGNDIQGNGEVNYFEILLTFYLYRGKFRAASKLMFSCYEQLVADAAGEESIESIAQTSATSKSLLATCILALGLLPRDQAFLYTHPPPDGRKQQESRMEEAETAEGRTEMEKEVLVADGIVLSVLFSLSFATETSIKLFLQRKLEDSLTLADLLTVVSSASAYERLVALLSRSGQVNLAVALAHQATELLRTGNDERGRFLQVRGVELSAWVGARSGSLSLYEVTVLWAIRTLHYLSQQQQNESACLMYDMKVAVVDMQLYGLTYPDSSLVGFDTSVRTCSAYFETYMWKQLLRWCERGLTENSDRLFRLSLSCILELDATQIIPSYVIHYPKELKLKSTENYLFPLLALFVRYRRLTEACQLAVEAVKSAEGSISFSSKKKWMSLGVLDCLIEEAEKVEGDEELTNSLDDLKSSIRTYLSDLVISEM